MKTILVQIASYRDDELPKTVASLLGRAKSPERLRFAIVHQYGPETVQLLDEYKGDERFRIQNVPWQEARGVGVARRQCNELYAGEDFSLQIDSHMRAEQDWDARLEQEWNNLNDSRAIVSSYPPAYLYDEYDQEKFVASNPNRLVVHQIYADFIPIFFGKELPRSTSPRGSFVAGGLQFAPGEVCRDIPYESRICFIGEEIVHSMRLFAAGYHVYSVMDQVLSHLYIRSENQKNVHHFWKDFQSDSKLSKVYETMNNTSLATVRSYFAGNELITKEQIAQFEDFAGVDIARKKVHPTTYTVPDLPMAENAEWRSAAIDPISYT